MNTFQISDTLYTHINLKFSLSEDTYAHTCAHFTSLTYTNMHTLDRSMDSFSWTLSLFYTSVSPHKFLSLLYTNRPMNMHTHDSHQPWTLSHGLFLSLLYLVFSHTRKLLSQTFSHIKYIPLSPAFLHRFPFFCSMNSHLFHISFSRTFSPLSS